MNFPEPNPIVLGFFFYQNFAYLPLLAVLALLRVIGGRGIARWPALVTFFLALGGVFTTFAPAAGLANNPIYTRAAQLLEGNGGMPALLVPSAVFLISAITPHVRWRWIDLLHGVMLAVLLGLWWWIS